MKEKYVGSRPVQATSRVRHWFEINGRLVAKLKTTITPNA
jgi:hypothetical protein